MYGVQIPNNAVGYNEQGFHFLRSVFFNFFKSAPPGMHAVPPSPRLCYFIQQ